MKIFGFIGPKGAGKDEAHKLLKKSSKVYGKISFAGPLKQICSDVFNIPIETMNDPILKEKELATPVVLSSKLLRKLKKALPVYVPEMDLEQNIVLYNIDKVSLAGIEGRVMKTPRELLQFIGTDFIRDRVYKEWHLQAAFGDKILGGLKQDKNYSVTDIRFPNELEFLQNKFGDAFKAYYIERPEAEERLAKATHPSELQVIELRKLVDKDGILKNGGSIEDFQETLKKIKAPSGDSTSAVDTGSRFVYGSRK